MSKRKLPKLKKLEPATSPEATNEELEHLPDIIPLGKVQRPYRGGVDNARNVRQASDLPSRLLLGKLERKSFLANGDDWQARYTADSSRIDLSWNRNNLVAVQHWHGREALTSSGDGTFAQLSQAGIAQSSWLREVPTILDPPLNVFIEPGDVELAPAFFSFFPDGLMLTLLLPIPFKTLVVCTDLFQHLDDDPRILAPMSAVLQRGWSVVNYIEAKSPQLVLTNNVVRAKPINRRVGKPTNCGVVCGFEMARTRRLHRTGAVRPRGRTRKST